MDFMETEEVTSKPKYSNLGSGERYKRKTRVDKFNATLETADFKMAANQNIQLVNREIDGSFMDKDLESICETTIRGFN